MTIRTVLSIVAAAAACLGSLGITNAAEPAKAAPIPDVTLTKNGTLTGVLVNSQGQPIAKSKVALSQGRKTISVVETNEKGQFEIKDTKHGVYQVSAGKQAAIVRAWSAEMAPPQARKTALLVTNESKVVRGQFEVAGLGGAGSIAAVGVLATSITLGTIGVVNANDAQDDADAANAKAKQLQAQIDQLTNTP